jgi:hypothetical protein
MIFLRGSDRVVRIAGYAVLREPSLYLKKIEEVKTRMRELENLRPLAPPLAYYTTFPGAALRVPGVSSVLGLCIAPTVSHPTVRLIGSPRRLISAEQCFKSSRRISHQPPPVLVPAVRCFSFETPHDHAKACSDVFRFLRFSVTSVSSCWFAACPKLTRSFPGVYPRRRAVSREMTRPAGASPDLRCLSFLLLICPRAQNLLESTCRGRQFKRRRRHIDRHSDFVIGHRATGLCPVPGRVIRTS